MQRRSLTWPFPRWSFQKWSHQKRSTALGLAITILLSCLVLVPSTLADDAEGGLERLLRLLRDTEDLDRDAARIRGLQIDAAIKRIYAKYGKAEIIRKIRRTFAGDEIANGYRIGESIEIWLVKRTPVTGHSIDLVVWHLERDDDGNIIRARGVGQDYHTRHPDNGRHHRRHWNSKVDTGVFWERILSSRQFEVVLEMNPDNSFYWREASVVFDDLDKICAQRKRRAATPLAELGSGVFASTSLKILGTGAGLTDLGASAYQVLEALRTFYRSPVLHNTRRLLEQGHTDRARQYWHAQCIDDQTLHRDCEALRLALAQANSMIGSSVFIHFPDGMELLLDALADDARQAEGGVEIDTPRPPPPARIAFEELLLDTPLEIRTPYLSKQVVLHRPTDFEVTLSARIDGYLVPVSGAPMRAVRDGETLEGDSDPEGRWTFEVPAADSLGQTSTTVGVAGQEVCQVLAVDHYDYIVEVLTDRANRVGTVGGEVLPVELRLRRRLAAASLGSDAEEGDAPGLRAPIGFEDDFEHIAFLTGDPELVDPSGAAADPLRVVPSSEDGRFSIGVRSEWEGEHPIRADLRGGAFRLHFTEVASFPVEFREEPEEHASADPAAGGVEELPPGLVPGHLGNCHSEPAVYMLTRTVVGLADFSFGDRIVVAPGAKVIVGSLPGDHLFFRVFHTDGNAPDSHVGGSFATATLPDVSEGWFFAVGCGDGPGSLCDDGRGGGLCREL